MPELLLEKTRGDVVECIHRGDIAVVDPTGKLLYHTGDPEKFTFFRSAAKPIQAMPLITSGAADRFMITDTEIAVICSSHYAEEFHRSTVHGILSRIGLTENDILGGTVTSLNPEYALKLAATGVPLTPIFSDCSGKHCGMLATCLHCGYETASYLDPTHPCQQNILNILAEICGIPKENIRIGIDGCNAPVHALPIRNMALGYARMANPSSLPDILAPAAEHICKAMIHHPEMISGTGGFCTELIKHTKGTLIGKIGAEGVYCVGLRGKNIGLAVKIENGSMDVLPPVVMHILDQLNCLDEEMREALTSFSEKLNVNDIGRVVGKYHPVFKLKCVS